jgi:hypothetical protein
LEAGVFNRMTEHIGFDSSEYVFPSLIVRLRGNRYGPNRLIDHNHVPMGTGSEMDPFDLRFRSVHIQSLEIRKSG